MSWARLDDRLFAHPKVRRLVRFPLGLEAFGLWVWSIAWCRSFSRLDGRLDPEAIADAWRLEPTHVEELLALLVRVRLVDELIDDEDPDTTIGFVIHDWRQWQFTVQQRGGLARAATAVRTGTGAFAPADEHGSSSKRPAGSPAGPNQPKPNHVVGLGLSSREGGRASGEGAAAAAGLPFRERVPRPGRSST